MAYAYIDREECIGDSLNKINYNANLFDIRIDTLSTTYVRQISSANNNILTSVNSSGTTTLCAIPFYKALVTFRGKNISNGNTCPIFTSYNVSNIIKIQEGMYRISFIEPIQTYGFTHACIVEEGVDATSVVGSNLYNPIDGGTVQNWLTGGFVSSVDVLSINTGLPPAFTTYKDVARATLAFY